MTQFFRLVGLIIVLSAPVLCISEGSAQNSTAPLTGMKLDRTTADPATKKAMMQKEAALRQKRTDCRKEARKEKISIFKRPNFVSDCMRR